MKSMLSRYILQGRTVFLSCALAIFAFMLLRVWSITLLGSEEFREIIKHFNKKVGQTYRIMVVYNANNAIGIKFPTGLPSLMEFMRSTAVT